MLPNSLNLAPHNETKYSFPPALSNQTIPLLKVIDPFKQIEVELTNTAFKISARQFAHRLVPAYLDKEEIVGINSLSSVNHWIELITLWFDNKCLFLSLAVSKKDLEHLLTTLNTYKGALERDEATYNENSKNKASACRKSAKATLAEIQEGLKHKKTFYIPLGYAHSPTSGGHAIPLKLSAQGKHHIEAVFLNLGDGLKMHPQVDWSPSGLRFHFQSFPVWIDWSTLSSGYCEDVFTRLMLLKAEPCPPTISNYSAEDVYAPIYSLGKIQSSFDSKIADRSRKPQVGDICGDMAILLIIKDVLIDLGYNKQALQRLVTLEKLCDILFFYQNLREKGGPLDDWILLKNGLKEVSIRGLKSCGETLSEKELEWLHDLFKPIFFHTSQQITQQKINSLPITSLQKEQSQTSIYFNYITHNPIKSFYGSEIPKEKLIGDSYGTPPSSPIKPNEILHQLTDWLTLVKNLNEKTDSKAHAFVYRVLCSFEVPDPITHGYWDKVPLTDISGILDCLHQLALYGVERSEPEKGKLIYRNALILSIGYAIADRLVRRKYTSLFRDFASPFYPSRSELSHYPQISHLPGCTKMFQKDKFFEFWMLPLKQANTRWVQVRNYFEKQQANSKYNLFALGDKKIDIAEGVRDLKASSTRPIPSTQVQEHLKFLEQFLKNGFPKNSRCSLSLSEQFIELWMNADCQHIPKEIEILYSFAHFSHDSFNHAPSAEADFRVPRKINGTGRIEILFLNSEILINQLPNAYLGETFSEIERNTWETHKKLSENKTQCLEYTASSSEEWNTHLYRQWTRIFSNPSLQITSLTQWMRNNISLLHQKKVQQFIEVALFMPGILANKIKEEPSTLNQLRKLIGQAIIHYSKSSFNNFTSLFLQQLGVCLESYAPQPCLDALSLYEARLLESIEETSNPVVLYQHLLFLYQCSLPRGEHSLRELIKAQFWLAYHEKDPEWVPLWIQSEISHPLERYHQATIDCFKQKEWLDQTFDEIFKLILDSHELPKGPCKGTYPLIQKGDYQIDIQENFFLHGPKQLLYIDKETRRNFPALEVKKGLAWRGSQGLEILFESGLHKIRVCKNGLCDIVQRFHDSDHTILGQWFHSGQIDPQLFGGSMLADKTYFDHWIGPKIDLGRHIVICRKNENTPLYIAIKDESGFCIRKILPHYTFHSNLINIWNEEHPLSSWFERLGAKKETCVWEYSTSNNKKKILGESKKLDIDTMRSTVGEIDFLQLNLTFKNEKGCFCSQNYPDFFLADEQSLAELNGFTGALILEPFAKEKQKMVLIPARELERTDKNFSTIVTMKEKFLPIKERIFLYQLDEIAQILINPHPEANLFLALLFAMQRDYNQALFYLERSRSYSSYKETDFLWAIEAFTQLQDHSPEALAFHLRLSLHLIHNSQQLILSEYGKRKVIKGGLEVKFFKWIANKIDKYFCVHSMQEITRIPESKMLSREEEVFLLEFLKKALTKEDWKEIFDIRLSLLQQKKWSKTITPSMYHINQCEPLRQRDEKDLKSFFEWNPPNFSHSEIPLQDFVRLDETEIRSNFMTLYERALKGETEIDLFYLTRSGKAGERFYSAYGLLLRYVQKNPGEFKALKFGNDPIANQKIFQEIIEAANLGKVDNLASVVVKLMTNHSVFFCYQKFADLTLPSLPVFSSLDWNFSDQEKIRLLKTLQSNVFKHFQKFWLETSQEPNLGLKTPFAFASLNSAEETPTMQMQLTKWRAGYKTLQDPRFGRTVYKLKTGKTISECLEGAKSILASKQKKNLKIKEITEKLANTYPDKSYFIGIRKISSNLPEITMEGILTKAYQNKNTLIIKKANPSLLPNQIYTLIFNTIEYHIRRIQIHQLERAIVELEKKGSIQSFAEAMACHGEFNPLQDPEIFLYQSRTGKALRKQQAELLSWEFSTSSNMLSPIRLFAAPAGGGKTTLYLPIAMKRFARLGFTPISVSSKPLYLVDREGLKESSQHIFSFELDVLELALSTETRAADFQWFFEQLTHSKADKGFKITPEVYFALHLKYQLALENEECESVQWLSQIFAFLSSKGVALVDECRLNCSPLTQAKIGMGKPTQLLEFDRAVILEIYQAFLNNAIYLPDDRSVKETVGLHKNQQATMTEKELEQVKESIFSILVKNPLLEIPYDQQMHILAYWSDMDSEPQWLLQNANAKQSRAIELIKVYFDEFYHKSMKLIWGMQHVRSIRPGEELHVPARAKQATRANFEEVYISLIATIHGCLQQGLDLGQVQSLLKELERKATEEVGSSGKISQAERDLGRWIGKENVELNRISAAQLSRDEHFYELVHKNPAVIFWYLEHVVLKQIVFNPEQLSVTPADFLHAFHSITLFSADPGPEEIYGIFRKDQNVYTDPLFFTHAIQQFINPTNTQFLTFSFPATPIDFYHSLLEQDPKIFTHLRMICDAGGSLRNFTAKELVSDFFELLIRQKEIGHDIDIDGVIIFEEASDKEAETELLLWLTSWSKPKIIKGHDVVQALRSLGLQWDKLNLLTMIDPSHRAGANIEQPKGSSVLVLLGEDLTLSNTVQGTLRGRGVLSGDQRVIWGAERKLVYSISQNISTQKSLEWEARNEARAIDQEILLSAYQQIDYFISAPVWSAIKLNTENPKEQIKLWHAHRRGLVKKTEIDPIKRFKGKCKLLSSKKLLWDYAKEKYNLFGYSTPWNKAISVHAKLTPIIESVTKRQPELLCTASFNVMSQTYIHTFQKEEMRKEFISNSHDDIKAESPCPLPERLTIDKDNFAETMIGYCQSASHLFNSSFLTTGLWFTEDAIHTAKSGMVSLKEEYLKPVQYILITKKDKIWHAFALSDGEAQFFQKQLNETENASCQCALLSADGLITQNGKKKCGFSAEELQINFVQDVVIDVSLTRCELLHPLRFIERIDTWTDFWPMWSKIKKCQPFAYTGHTQLVEKHVPTHIKEYVPIIKSQPSLIDSVYSFMFG
ncbi:MAG: hypothetical protein H0T62_05460 [Parachlamydiaceae bacterium]|nr:hypothetical protein [Parachlamydiaceae bacterium]